MGIELLLIHHIVASSFLYSLPTLLPTTFHIKQGHPFHKELYIHIHSLYVPSSHSIYKAKQMLREVKRLLHHNMAGKYMQQSTSLGMVLPLAPRTQ